jgi:NAD(P)-dependent dehydrogenase (short-subunit alcohol dehydrogenase family)
VARLVRQWQGRLHILVGNAGVVTGGLERTGEGWELQFATNHLGHFALVNRLWPLLTVGGARVVSVSSAGHRRTGIRWDDVMFEHGYDKWTAYGQAKSANALFAVQLDALGAPAGVRAFAVHPGGIMTPLQRHLGTDEMVEMGWIDKDGNPLHPSFKTPDAGAATQTWCATSPQLADQGGVYCEDCDIAVLADGDSTVGVRQHAIDPDDAARLWTLSAELTGVDAFATNSRTALR